MAKRWDLFIFLRRTMYSAFMYSPNLEQHLPNVLKKWGFLLELMIEMWLYLVTVHIAALYVCTIYLNFGKSDLEFLVNCFMQLVIYLWTILMKLYFRRFQNSRLEDLMDFINFNYKPRSAIGSSYVTMDKTYTMADKWLRVYVYSAFVTVICWLLIPLSHGDRSLPLDCWYPFDYKKPVVYEIIYFLQFVGQIQVAAAFASSAIFHMALSILISGQYDVLCCSLKNIFTTVSVINKRDAGPNVSEFGKLQPLEIAECNEYYCSIEVKCHTEASASCTVGEVKPHFRAHYRRNFKECIHHHYFILKCLNKMEAFYSPIWFLKVGEVTLLLCLVAFVSTKSSPESTSFIKILSLAQYLLMITGEFLMICYFGEIVVLNSQRCFDAVLRSPWYLYMPEMKTDFLIFLQVTKKPFQLTAGKIYALNIECFRGIMTTAFSFLTVLQSIDERNV